MNHVEVSVRRQQLVLLRFEKFVRSIAPIAITAGLGTAILVNVNDHLSTLARAQTDFVELTGPREEVRVELVRVVEDLKLGFTELGADLTPEARTATLTRIMTSLDEGHYQAELAALQNSIRLIGAKLQNGRKADGGTPKTAANVNWLIASFRR